MNTQQAAAYLPYGLIVKIEGHQHTIDYVGNNSIGIKFKSSNGFNTVWYKTVHAKPILRPLSDLTKEITVNGETFVPVNHLKHKYGWEYIWSYATKPQGSFNINAVAYACVKELLSWHFDVFGLIESGEAIDVKTLETNPYECG